jgi:hypothetical protein
MLILAGLLLYFVVTLFAARFIHYREPLVFSSRKGSTLLFLTPLLGYWYTLLLCCQNLVRESFYG